MARTAHINGRDIPPVGGNISNKTGCERHGRWIYCYDARATAFWIEKIRKNKEAKTMAIEFGSRRETFENFKVYETKFNGN